MTAEELLRLPDDGLRHELIYGELCTMILHGGEHGLVAGNALELLSTYVRSFLLLPPGLEAFPDFERIDFVASAAQTRQAATAAPLRPLPLSDLAKSNPFDVPPDMELGFPVDALDRAWRLAQDGLATLVPHARFSIASRGGHNIHQEQPSLVIEAIRQVVAGVPDPDTWYDLGSCCAP